MPSKCDANVSTRSACSASVAKISPPMINSATAPSWRAFNHWPNQTNEINSKNIGIAPPMIGTILDTSHRRNEKYNRYTAGTNTMPDASANHKTGNGSHETPNGNNISTKILLIPV